VGSGEVGELLHDSLSCRMQFNQMLSRPVAHPVEILNAADKARNTD
jgi:hypothetical protein